MTQDAIARHRKYLEEEIEVLESLISHPMLHQTVYDTEQFIQELRYFKDQLASLNMCFA